MLLGSLVGMCIALVIAGINCTQCHMLLPSIHHSMLLGREISDGSHKHYKPVTVTKSLWRIGHHDT